MPKRWKTDEVLAALSDIGIFRRSQPGGDVDTTALTLYIDGEWISVCGLVNCGSHVENPDDCEVCWVEVRTDGDSAGGLQTESEIVGAAYGRIVARLRKMGFAGIVPTYDGLY